MSSFANPKKYILKWYAAALRKHYPNGFTTKEAELLYLQQRRARIDPEHLPYNGRYGDPTWPSMNARNALCCMVQVGDLRRQTKGIYVWPSKGLPAYLERMDLISNEEALRRNTAADKKLLRLQKAEGSQNYLQMISRDPNDV